MAFDFPATPALGQVFGNYIWDGEKWKLQGGQALGSVRYDTPQILSAGQQAQARSNIAAPDLSALSYSGMQINGAFNISQEKGTGATTAGEYICDGWKLGTSVTGLVCGINQGNPVPGLNYLLYISTATAKPSLAAGDIVLLEQKIEGYRVARLAWGQATAQPITIGFWSAHTPAGTYSIAIHNNAGDRSYVTSYTQNVSNTWEYKTVTIPGDTAGNWEVLNLSGMQLVFMYAGGSTYVTASPNTWLASGTPNVVAGQVNGLGTTSSAFRITGVVVLPGIEAPTAAQSPLIMRPFDQELLTCQRYYQKVIDKRLQGYFSASSPVMTPALFVPSMRAGATVTVSTSGYPGDNNCGAISAVHITAAGFVLTFTAPINTYYTRFDYTADARL